jgi:hypothetical protein
MKTLYSVILALFTGGSILSATPAASPRDPGFLDNFSDQQKIAIHRYLTLDQKTVDELVTPLEPVSAATLDAEGLKKAYSDYLNDLNAKFGIQIDENKQESNLLVNRKTNAVDYNRLSESITKKCERKGRRCANTTRITAEDIGCNGYTINKPGRYRLCIPGGIFHWKPANIANMITIDADNVILDLRHTSVVQRPNSAFASSAINILSERQNITIQNGNLVGFTAETIKADVVNQLLIKNISINDNHIQGLVPDNFGSIVLETCSNVILQDIRIANSTLELPELFFNSFGGGILLVNLQNFLVQNCDVSNSRIFGNAESAFSGILILECHNGIIKNCNVANCTSTGIMSGFNYNFSDSILTENCTSSYNIGVQTTGGFYSQISSFLQFVNCEASHNRSQCQDCHGFPYFISTNGYFSNCRALSNTAESPTGGFSEKATGFEIFISVYCLLDNCIASNNLAVNPIRHYAAGFANATSIDVTFRNCVSSANSARGNSSRGVGFGPALDPRFYLPSVGTIWENCISEANSGDTLSIGFDLFGQVGAILTGSKSQNQVTGQGIGILSNGPYDQGNPVDVPCDVVPVIVETGNAANDILVKDNIVVNNSFGGIVDLTGANNVYIDNTVFNNGINFIGPIFASGTPIRDWTVQSAPSNANNNGVVGDKLDNLNITTP